MCKHPGAIRAKHFTPTTGGPACACLRVRFNPVTHPDGSKTERWRCKDCGARFIRAEQMPGPIVPSDFPPAGSLLDDEHEDHGSSRAAEDDDLAAAITKHDDAAERYEAPGHGSSDARARWCAYQRQLAAWLRELDDLRRIAYDLHSLAAAAWQHIRATDDKQRDEANAVCDKLLEGGPLWLCSPRIPAVGSGMCNVATVGIAEANRDRARLLTLGWPIWKLAIELAHAVELFEEGRGAEVDYEWARESLGRLVQGGDLWWLGEGDKDAQAWGLLQLGTVRCAACGNEIAPPAHLVAVAPPTDLRLAPMCLACWETERVYSQQSARNNARDRVLRAARALAEEIRTGDEGYGVSPGRREQKLLDAVAELKQIEPSAHPRTNGDAVSSTEPPSGPSETAPASEPPCRPGERGRYSGLPIGGSCGAFRADCDSAAAVASRLLEAFADKLRPVEGLAERGTLAELLEDVALMALRLVRRGSPHPDDELALARHQLRLADHAINALCVHAGPEQQRKWGSREAVRAYRLSLPHPITGAYEPAALTALRAGSSAPEADIDHGLYDASRPAWGALRAVAGPYTPAFVAAAHLLAALSRYPDCAADAFKKLASERCRAGSEPNSLNDLAARLLEAVLAQHKEADDEPA